MKIEGIRLIESILTQLGFTSYIYKPTGTKLAAVTITTFLEDVLVPFDFGVVYIPSNFIIE